MDWVGQVNHLARIEMDAVRAAAQAIDNVDEAAIKDMLTEVRLDHQRHADDLAAMLARAGRQAPRQAHLSGFAMAGITGIAAGMGTGPALMAMQSNEVVTTQAYELALAAALPEDVRDLLARNLDDASRHLAAIRNKLERSFPAGRVMSGSATMQGLGASVWMNVVRANPVTTALSETGVALALARRLISPRHHGPGHGPDPGG